MGSIIAILARSIPVDTGIARQMLAAAPHRGSDLNVRVCGNCILGVNNKDDSTDSTISSEGPLMAVLAGKLDNALELTNTLSAAGHSPVSTNAADIAVAAFKVFGTDAPNRMRGQFAGVVTDGRQISCFRDHIGFKPLFYRDDPSAFFVATEAKQIVAGAKLRREPDLDVLKGIFYGKMPGDMPSAMKGVGRLPQASVLSANGRRGSPVVQRYWNPCAILETGRYTEAEVADRFTELFAQAVDRSLTGKDVISLSGGIDSPGVAAFAAPQHLERTGRPISALSAVFPDLPSVDESSYIELVSKYLGIELHTYRIQAQVFDDLQHWCGLADGPIPTTAITQQQEYYNLARKLGFRNVLTGELAEFLFCYDAHLLGHLLIHGRWSALARLISKQRGRGVPWNKIANRLFETFVPAQIGRWYSRARGLDSPKRIPDWLNRSTVQNEAFYRTDLLDPIHRRWLEYQLLAFSGCTGSLEASDLCEAINGVTVRRPFTDIDLWEFFLSLPAELKFPDTRSKTLIRQLLRGKLPDAILDRRDKTVFDDHIMAQIDYPLFERFLSRPNHRIAGVDYERLAARIENRDFKLVDFLWANDLVRIHAFLGLW